MNKLEKAAGRLLCLMYGHRRGKLVRVERLEPNLTKGPWRSVRYFRCPRCGHETHYKSPMVPDDVQ